MPACSVSADRRHGHARCLRNFPTETRRFASDKNPTEGEVGEVQRASRHDLVRALAPRYAHVGKREKGQMLDEVCQLTGYTRKYAVTLLKHPPADEPAVKRTRHRSASYGPAEVELLQLCWLVTDGICAKRLAPFLPELLHRLRRWHALREFPVEVQARVAQMSAATVDRALRPYRDAGRTPRHQHHQTRRAAQTPDRHSHVRRLDGCPTRVSWRWTWSLTVAGMAPASSCTR